MTEKRETLELEAMAEQFITLTRDDDPGLYKALKAVPAKGLRYLGGILGRFSNGVADPQKRLLARRILGRLRKPDTEMLVTVNKILDYLDLNSDSRLDAKEMELCVEVLEKFSGADSKNQTLSALELELLHAVLRFLDRNSNGMLDPEEKEDLNKGLSSLKSFLKQQYQLNQAFRDIAVRHGLVF